MSGSWKQILGLRQARFGVILVLGVFLIALERPLVATAVIGDELAWFSADNDETYSVAWGDVDGDGDLDLAVANFEANKVYLNEGAMLATTAGWASVDGGGSDLAWGDVDKDGDLDLAVGSKVYFNENGTLATTAGWVAGDGSGSSVAWGDVDGDGDLDLAVRNKVYINENGLLETNAAWVAPDSDGSSIAWGDVDADGDLDLIMGNFGGWSDGQTNKIFYNEAGALSTTAGWIAAESDRTTSIALGDIDADEDLDLIVGNNSQPVKIYLNEDGVFEAVPSWVAGESEPTSDIALGDVDGDGDLDLVIGNDRQTNKVYLNQNGAFGTIADWFLRDSDDTSSIALGDMDGDGDLDLAVGNGDSVNKVYANNGGTLATIRTWALTDPDDNYSLAWGDVDGDGDLDLAVGNHDSPNKIYFNHDGMLEATASWVSADSDWTYSVAWGDVDEDGDLDLAVGNYGQRNKVYFNENGILATTAGWISTEREDTTNVAWGDMDGDGDLDLAVANYDFTDKIYYNDGGILESTASWEPDTMTDSQSVAWGDVDGDSDLDLAIGSDVEAHLVYLNEGGTIAETAAIESNIDGDTYSVAWGDMDGDDDLDLAVGNYDRVNLVYINEGGTLAPIPGWVSLDSDATVSIAWGDVDGDGDLDLAVGNYDQVDKVYRNNGGMLSRTADWVSANNSGFSSVAWGDIDMDGDLDLAIGNDGLYLNQLAETFHDDALSSRVSINLQGEVAATHGGTQVALASANFYALTGVREGVIPISYNLFHPSSQLSGQVKVYYSLNGGGYWREAVPTAVSPTINLGQEPYPTVNANNSHTFYWDTFASGFFGQSDNVVLRFEVLPNYSPRNGTPSFQRPFVATQTFPFRVRGTQVRVYDETIAVGNEMTEAMVYRLPAGQTSGAELLTNGRGEPFQTDHNGYLQGHGALGLGDQIMAMVPVETADSYTVYHTSAAPTTTGLALDTITEPGVQTLTVSSDNALILYDLVVSLEWDARGDTAYLAQLEADLHEASRRLFDLSNGQMALGEVQVFHDKERWLTANVVVQASNAMRPNADLGGSVITPTLALLSNGEEVDNGYLPGQVRMAATWNRNGDPGGTTGVDWPRALAHELAHYFFFVPDNYLGLDETNRLVPTDCRGSVMTDAYRNDYSEFLTAAEWQADSDCLRTVAELSTGRSDWETVQRFYPFLDASGGNVGPTSQPLAITEVVFVEPETAVSSLEDPYLNIVAADGSTLPLPYSNVHAYQFETNGTFDTHDDRIIPLGVPVGALLQTRGAGQGDRVCVFDNNHSPRRIGCNDSLSIGDHTVTMREIENWQPEIVVSPVISASGTMTETEPLPMVAITVTQTAVLGDLYVQVYPTSPFTDTGTVTAPTALMTLASGHTDTYTATITLDDPAFEGHVQVWVEGTDKIDIASFYFGGGWGPNRYGWGPNRYGWGPNRYGWGPNRYGWGVGRQGWNAPIMSGNGQVTLFDIDYMFGDTPPYTLQSLPIVPALPPWLTPVGEAYRVGSLESFTEKTSILFSYLQRNVPDDDYEQALQIYFLPENDQEWLALDTALDTDINQASALLLGSGSYMLAMTIEMPAFSKEWNTFGYPAQTARPVAEALASIEGKYTSVYNYNPQLPDPWRIYDSTVPVTLAPLVNTLENLEFAQAYWLYATEAITSYLPVDNKVASLNTSSNIQFPPATFYGWLEPTADFAPVAGMMVTAEIDGTVCGQTTVVAMGDKLAYALQVQAENLLGLPNGCGAKGKTVIFKVHNWIMDDEPVWDNSQAWQQSLRCLQGQSFCSFSVYLPTIRMR